MWVATTPVSLGPSVPTRPEWDSTLRESVLSLRAVVELPHSVLTDLSNLLGVYSTRLTFAYLLDSAAIGHGLHLIDHHNLIFRFNQRRLYLAVLDPLKGRNYFSLRPGLLLKYLEGRKKGAKHVLTTKLLLMRLLRKLLIVSRLDFFDILVKGVPLHLPQLFSFLNRPLPHVIYDPVNGSTIDETGDDYYKIRYHSLQFLRGKPYGYQKTRKRGRVKRKVRRKIINSARVIDEL